jgi:four helix bundle protein
MDKIDSIAYKKAYKFAIRIVNLSRYMIEEKKEYIISKQIMKSSTSSWIKFSRSEWSDF